MINETQHYLGTIILQETGEVKIDEIGQEYHEYEVVDGQQRLTRLSILLLAVCDKLGDGELKKHIVNNFIGVNGATERMKLSGSNNDFYKGLEKAVLKKESIEERTNKIVETIKEEWAIPDISF